MWSCYVGVQALQHNAFSKPDLAHNSLVLYGIRAPLTGPFCAWKPTILMTKSPLLVTLEHKKNPIRGFLFAPGWFFMA